MATSKKLKQKHAAQAAAAQVQFENYKDFIVKELVEKFGGSYQTAETMKDVWRDSFIFHPECEKFLITKTQMFLFLLEDKHNNKSPCFLKTLIGLISEYLAKYICKKGISRNDCTQQLIKVLFTDNRFIQNKLKSYQKEVAGPKKPKQPKIQKNKNCEKVAEAVHRVTKERARQIINLKIYVSELVK